MKRPAFQFYPADWRKDTALQSCSLAARGLWHEMICLMHECEPYGYMSVNGKPMKSTQIARLVGVTDREYSKLLVELEDAGVYSTDDDGCIYSRRMVKDEHLRNVRAEAGKKGGNPSLLGGKVKDLDKQKANQTDKQIPTPSSSSSSSSSSPSGGKEKETASPSAPPAAKQKFVTVTDLTGMGVDEKVASEFIAHRNRKRAKLTDLALAGMKREAAKAGWSLENAMRKAVERGWLAFEAAWVTPDKNSGPPANRPQAFDPVAYVNRNRVHDHDIIDI